MFKDGLGIKGRGNASNIVVNTEIKEWVYKQYLVRHPQLKR